MNKKSRFCLFTCSSFVVLLLSEILYLHAAYSLTPMELAQKKQFIKTTTLSNLNLALKNNYIKTLP
jgi:hypothetical protein